MRCNYIERNIESRIVEIFAFGVRFRYGMFGESMESDVENDCKWFVCVSFAVSCTY